MTEEIIIDGVDVSECNYFNKVVNEEPYCNIDEEHLYTCSSDENCYFKQLKRLEFELKVTKADYEASEQENKELKEMLSKEPKAMQAFQISYSGLKKDNETLWGMVKDYKTALEEIREYVNRHPAPRKDRVINKINEVLNG